MRPNQIREFLEHLAIIRFPGDPQCRSSFGIRLFS
jgi:hypothetical protein